MAMDPLSITTACITLLGAIGKTTQAVTNFVRTCREARDDLAAVSRELSDLRIVLELLVEDSATKASLPAAFEKHVLALVGSCLGITTQLTGVLENHDGRTGPARWAISGKETVGQLRTMLETHKGSLNLALDLANLVSSMAIKEDTSAIRSETIGIKEDTADLLRKISDVAAQMSRIRNDVGASRRNTLIPPTGEAIDHWLESLTSYAESTCDDLLQDCAPPATTETLPLVAAHTKGPTISYYDASYEDGGALKVSERHHFAYKNSIHFITMSGRHVVGADGFSNIIIWDAHTGKKLGAVDTRKSHSRDIYRTKVAFICGHDSNFILLTQYGFGASVWDWKRGKRVLDVQTSGENVLLLSTAHYADTRGAILWHDENTIWKADISDWKKKVLTTIPGTAKFRQIGVRGMLVAFLMDDGSTGLLDSLSGSVKATKTVYSPDKLGKSVAKLTVLQQNGGQRVFILVSDKINGVVTVTTWDIEKNSVNSNEYGGYEKKEAKRGAMWESSWFKEGQIIYVAHDQGLDLIDIATQRKRRYKTVFPRNDELESTKVFRYGLFRSCRQCVVLKLGCQPRIGIWEGKHIITTRATGGGVQVWDWDIEDNPFGQDLDLTVESRNSMGGWTLDGGSGPISRKPSLPEER